MCLCIKCKLLRVEYRGNHKISILFKQVKVDWWHPLKMPFLIHHRWRQESGLIFSPRAICLPVGQSWQIGTFQIVSLISKNKIQSGKISQRIIFINRNYSRAFYPQLATEEKEPIWCAHAQQRYETDFRVRIGQWQLFLLLSTDGADAAETETNQL